MSRPFAPDDRIDPGLASVRGRIGRPPDTMGQTMSIKLTDTQLVMLGAAAQREDHCIAAPASLKIGAAQKIAAKLIAAGLAKEIKAKAGAVVWRRDEETGQAYALRATAAGMAAIAVEVHDAPGAEVDTVAPAYTVAAVAALEVAIPDARADNLASVVDSTAPREGSKLAAVVGLLQRESGATLAELITATHWLPHTTRAALTGLRKRGYEVALTKAKDERASAYLIAGNSNKARG